MDELFGTMVEGSTGPVLAPRVLPASQYRSVDRELLRMWLHVRGIYGIPTVEAITWLRTYLRGREGLEIGAAHGAFGTALGIPTTDSFVQQQPDVVAFYSARGQPCVPYAMRVEKIEALRAVKQYRPRVVFGSWITQYGLEGRSSMYGVREDQILARKHVEAYIVFGSQASHASKMVAKKTPAGWRFRQETQAGFLSRADPSIMFIWERVG